MTRTELVPPTSAGIHHVTAICGDPRRILDFYRGVLGLRLVKRTVNFDDPGTYHLYFGDAVGSPGTILTFFPWPHLPPGRQGTGTVVRTAFRVPRGAVPGWHRRLGEAGVRVPEPLERGGAFVLPFEDPDGLPLELVEGEVPEGARPWEDERIPPEERIIAFHGVGIAVAEPGPTAATLEEVLGLDADGGPVDLLHTPQARRGLVSRGSVHHVAFRAADSDAQAEMRERALEAGLGPTPVVDRSYFQSVYFREPGGVLFEIATDAPGFLIDEEVDTLGTGLRLPPWMESRRAEIEGALPPL